MKWKDEQFFKPNKPTFKGQKQICCRKDEWNLSASFKKNWKLPQIHEPNVLNESIPWNCKMNQVGTSYWK